MDCGPSALYSLAAGALWFLFIRVAWPDEVEAWADAPRESERR